MTTTREDWITRVIQSLASWLEVSGREVPQKLRAGCGWPAGLHERGVLGACYSPDVSASGHYEIFVSPTVDEALQVAAILAHEVCHAVHGMQEGHGREFLASCRSLGLEGPATATVPGDTFRAWFEALSEHFGAYPHSRMMLPDSDPEGTPEDQKPPRPRRPRRVGGPKAQTSRLIKASCPEC